VFVVVGVIVGEVGSCGWGLEMMEIKVNLTRGVATLQGSHI
jgi:hypothetical protein